MKFATKAILHYLLYRRHVATLPLEFEFLISQVSVATVSMFKGENFFETQCTDNTVVDWQSHDTLLSFTDTAALCPPPII